MSGLLKLTDLSLVPGPIELPDPAYSYADNWKTEQYTTDDVAAAILAVPDVRLIKAASPDWDSWKARWESSSHHIEFDVCACPINVDDEIKPGVYTLWGGSGFVTHCTLQEMLQVWRFVRKRLPGACLHDTDCRMYSPESFETSMRASEASVRRKKK